MGRGHKSSPDELLFGEPLQSEIWIPPVVPQHPNPDISFADVVQEVVRKALQITAPKPAPIEMETPGIFNGIADSDFKLCEKVLSKLI